MREGKYAYTKEDSNAQGKMQTRKGRCKHARADSRNGRCKGSLGNCEGGIVLMITDKSRQT